MSLAESLLLTENISGSIGQLLQNFGTFVPFMYPMTLGVQKPKLAKAPQKPPKAPKSSKSAKGGLCGGQGPQFDPSEIWVQIGFPWDLGGKVD